MILKEKKTACIENSRLHETDTGSPEVQIAILTARRLLHYLQRKDIERYRAAVAANNLRK